MAGFDGAPAFDGAPVFDEAPSFSSDLVWEEAAFDEAALVPFGAAWAFRVAAF
jgi:hypothetical protein